MRRTLLAAAVLAALSACSKPAPDVEAKSPQPSAAQTPPENNAAAESDSSPIDVKAAALANAVKVDFASQFVASASEACASVQGQQPPDSKSGSPMQYTAAGVISWGKGSLDYVKEPDATLLLTNSRSQKTFAFSADIGDRTKGNRKYVAGLSQLDGASLSATVTDSTKAVDGDANMTTGNLCVGNTVPPLVTQGAWPLAAKYLRVPETPMACRALGKIESQKISFAFDGTAIQAGTERFTQADSVSGDTLSIDPKGNLAAVTYSVARSDGTGVGLGLSQANMLTYASIDLPGGVHLICGRR